MFLNQGWTEDERNWFYTVSQGSWMVPYSWWLVLEDADSEQLFGRDDAIRPSTLARQFILARQRIGVSPISRASVGSIASAQIS